MASNLYQSIFYGAGSFYGQGDVDVPQDGKYYRTNVDGVYVFHWGFKEEFITPLIPSLTFELQIASDYGFTENVSTFNAGNAISYQNGNVRKGYAIPVASRLDKQEQTWYARARCIWGVTPAAWSEPLPFLIPQRWTQQEAENFMQNLPDEHVYGKEDLLKAVAQRNSNLYTVGTMYGREFDQTYLEDYLTKTNNYIDFCRDEYLYDNFGYLFNYKKPTTQVSVEYRECIRNLVLGALTGGTVNAIQGVVRCFTGVNPTLQLARQRQDFFIDYILETPSDTIDGLNQTFTTSSTYITGSLSVLQNGTPLTSGVDFTEDQAIPGFLMTVAPNPGDILEVLFQIGNTGDPESIIFDPFDRAALTGTITFTNESAVVSGVGTSFTTELVIGDYISDTDGQIIAKVSSIADNQNLILTSIWRGVTGTGAGFKLNTSEDIFTPPILWDANSLAYGLIIIVHNPGLFTLQTEVIEQLVRPLLPAHVKAFFIFE